MPLGRVSTPACIPGRSGCRSEEHIGPRYSVKGTQVRGFRLLERVSGRQVGAAGAMQVRFALTSGQDAQPCLDTQVSAAAAAADRVDAWPPSGGDAGSDRVGAVGAYGGGYRRYAGELVPA